ncbi:FtsX-like permease family protein [Actinophytocola sediminis]
MSALGRVARAAVRRRRVQTVVIGLVVAVSTGTIVLALGLLAAASDPFERAHDQQRGAHLVAAFDNTVVSADQLTQAADQAGVDAVAGPFGQTSLDTSDSGHGLADSLTTVGRADPGGAVDRLDVWHGRWVTGPGEIVLNIAPGHHEDRLAPLVLGMRIATPGHPDLTVVGFAYSVGASADAWVTPAQLADLGETTLQLQYRFTDAATVEAIAAGQAKVTAGLPGDAVLGTQSYLAVLQQLSSELGAYVPFLIVFGILGLTVSVLIVANVVSGAVVAGFRHIGVLKALGFTPNQVMLVYLVMVLVPAAAGAVVGTLVGNIVAGPLIADTFGVLGTGDVGIAVWVDVLALVGMPVVVALAAMVSALRARGLPAIEAISAGSAPKAGRALRIQRWLSGLRLPRSVSLGVGVSFARPARSALTLAAIVLGATTVTFAIGAMMSVNAYSAAMRPVHADRLDFHAGLPAGVEPPPGAPVRTPRLSDAQDEQLLRSTPGAVRVTAMAHRDVHVVGGKQNIGLRFYRGDTDELSPKVLSGQWPDGPGQVAASTRFLNQRGLEVGDVLTVELDGQRARLRIVGVVLVNYDTMAFADWSTLTALAPDTRAHTYTVQFAPEVDQRAYTDTVLAGDPGLEAAQRDSTSDSAVVLIGTTTLLTVVLGAVAALGVFNTVALNARERRRDLGMLKSIGMTPRQVTVMMVTSMGVLGVVGGLIGLPLGVATHQLVVPAMLRASQSEVFDFMLEVYRAPMLVLLGLAGVVIAVLGALLPARSAARTPIAAVLRNE